MNAELSPQDIEDVLNAVLVAHRVTTADAQNTPIHVAEQRARWSKLFQRLSMAYTSNQETGDAPLA